jgi:TonB family protein
MKNILVVLLALLPSFCFAQLNNKTYYLDGSFNITEYRKKALYSKAIKNADTLTIEITRLKDKQIIRREIYFKYEPIGNWIVNEEYATRQLNYDFKVRYANQICKKEDSLLFINYPNFHLNPFLDNDSTGYKAPKIATGEKGINAFIQRNVFYPSMAIDIGIEGTVMVLFIISEKGELEEVAVAKQRDSILDKEAMRVIRNLKFLNPPSLNGKSGKLCLAVPVSFILKK